MRIPRHPTLPEQVEARRSALLEILHQPDARTRRPCEGCSLECACQRHSPECACGCSPECSEAPRMLSSEPDRYPIEPGVLPLVFSLATLHVARPCWSCEGHAGASGEASLPQVWFTSVSALPAELLQCRADELFDARALAAPWVVSVCNYQGDPGSTTFAIAPHTPSPHLGQLRTDLRRIATHLLAELQRLAGRRLADLESLLSRTRLR